MKDLSAEDIDGSRLLIGALFMAARIARGGIASDGERVVVIRESLKSADEFLLAAADRSPLEERFGKSSTEHGR